EGKTPPLPCDDNELKTAAEQIVPEYLKAMDELAFHRALEAAWRLVSAIDRYIVAREPWKHFKENGADNALARIIWNCLEALRIAFVMVAPVMPQIAAEGLSRIGSDGDFTSSALAWGCLPNGVPLRSGDALFPVIDAAAFLEKKMEPTPPVETTEAAPPDLAKISIDQFMQTELRVAEVRAAERVPKSKKLIRMSIFTGDDERTIVAGIGTKYTPEELVGRKVVIVANLQPAKLMGIESNGMVLAASIDGEPSLLSVDPSVPAGTRVR
ncbi:MAG TPA: methionine--tRNA ligase subunit beta, partial [Thermoanaerobaculia bacterium]|nr:methionine--tRNA ligase subunit beta [Thermoanaerobaculia bacterium]